MEIGDPNSWAQGANAFKSIFDGLRSAIALLKEIQKGSHGTPDQQEMVTEALEKATKAAGIAEAQVAQALGYELCRCEFPPTPMRTIGMHLAPGGRSGPVYQCPICSYNTAYPYAYEPLRTGPRQADSTAK